MCINLGYIFISFYLIERLLTYVKFQIFKNIIIRITIIKIPIINIVKFKLLVYNLLFFLNINNLII